MDLYVRLEPGHTSALMNLIMPMLPSSAGLVPDDTLPEWAAVIDTGTLRIVAITEDAHEANGAAIAAAAANLGATHVIALPASTDWLARHLKEETAVTETPATTSGTTTAVLGLPEGQHPLVDLVPMPEPTARADCCGAAPVIAVLVSTGDDVPLLFCGHHARTHWSALAETLFAYRLLER